MANFVWLFVIGLAAFVSSEGLTNEQLLRINGTALGLFKSRSSFVRNGENANRAHWPFIVPIFQLAAGRMAHICGGAIVHPMFIVTAAHCFRKMIYHPQTRQPMRAEIDDDRRGYQIHVGDYNIASLRDGAVKVTIDRIIVHEKYRGYDARTKRAINNDPFDIAVIKLKNPLKYNNFIKQINIAPKNAVFDTGTISCFAAGWGLQETAPRKKPNILQQFEAKILHANSCKNFWGTWVNPQVNMCLGNGMKSQCRGDSGGPAVCPFNNQYVLAGVISFGSDDCNDKPGVLIKVPVFNEWIQTNVNKYVNVRG